MAAAYWWVAALEEEPLPLVPVEAAAWRLSVVTVQQAEAAVRRLQVVAVQVAADWATLCLVVALVRWIVVGVEEPLPAAAVWLVAG
jgi:hypothetical protein